MTPGVAPADARPARRSLLDFGFVAAPKILGGALLFGLNLLLLRYLGVEQYGVWGLCLAGILLADSILGGPLDLAVLRLAPGGDDVAVERAALRLKLAAGIAVGAALTLTAGLLGAGELEREAAWILVPLAALAATATLALRSVLVHLQLRGRFAAYGALDLVHVALRFGTIAILLLAAAPGVATLLALWTAAPLLAAAIGGAVVARALLASGTPPRAAYVALRGVAGWYVATVALGALIGRVDILALGLLAPIEQAGMFAAGHALAVVPELLGSYLAIVLTPRIRDLAREGRLARFHARVLVALLAGAAIALLLAVALRDALLPVLLPARFLPSASVAMILLPGTLAAMATVPLALPIVMFWRKTLVLRMDCVLLPALLVLYAIVVPRHGAVGAAWLTSGACVLRSLVVQTAAWRLAAPGGIAEREPPAA